MKGLISLFLAAAMSAAIPSRARAQQPPTSNPPSTAPPAHPATQPAAPNQGAPSVPASPSPESGVSAPGPAGQTSPTPVAPSSAPVQEETSSKTGGPPLDAHSRYAIATDIYRAAARVDDLMSIVQPDHWKMDEAARKSFDETRQKAQDAMKALVASDAGLTYHPDDVALSLKTRALAQTALLLLNQLSDAAATFDGDWVKQLRSSIEALNAGAQPLARDEAAATTPAPAPSPAPATSAASNPPAAQPETEKVEIPGGYNNAPPATLENETGTLQPAEVKQLLYKAYVAGFRFNDLLTVLQPGQWKIDDATRQQFDATVDAVRQDLKDFETWRGQFEVQPDDIFFGYKTYTSMTTALPIMDELADQVSRYQSSAAGTQFRNATEEFRGARKSVDGYLSFLLRNRHELRATVENDLAKCQNTLNYAMYGKTGSVTNMPNINPVFRGHLGHPRAVARKELEEKAASASAKKAEAHSVANGKSATPPKAPAKGARRGTKRTTHSKSESKH